LPKVLINGNNIKYITGEEVKNDRATILMVHGAGQSIATWVYQHDFFRLNKGLNLIILDLPGHGKSNGEGCRAIHEYSSFLKRFSDVLNLSKLILVGHSMGGGIAQMFTLEFPQLVKACTLVGTGVRLRVAKETLDYAKNNFEAFCKIAPSRSFAESSSEELRIKYYDGLLNTSKDVIYNDLVACDEFDITEEVSRIEVPTLIVSADQDILTPVKYGELLRERIKGSKLHVIKNSGHFMMQEKPEEFNEALTEFLGTLT